MILILLSLLSCVPYQLHALPPVQLMQLKNSKTISHDNEQLIANNDGKSVEINKRHKFVNDTRPILISFTQQNPAQPISNVTITTNPQTENIISIYTLNSNDDSDLLFVKDDVELSPSSLNDLQTEFINSVASTGPLINRHSMDLQTEPIKDDIETEETINTSSPIILTTISQIINIDDQSILSKNNESPENTLIDSTTLTSSIILETTPIAISTKSIKIEDLSNDNDADDVSVIETGENDDHNPLTNSATITTTTIISKAIKTLENLTINPNSNSIDDSLTESIIAAEDSEPIAVTTTTSAIQSTLPVLETTQSPPQLKIEMTTPSVLLNEIMNSPPSPSPSPPPSPPPDVTERTEIVNDPMPLSTTNTVVNLTSSSAAIVPDKKMQLLSTTINPNNSSNRITICVYSLIITYLLLIITI